MLIEGNIVTVKMRLGSLVKKFEKAEDTCPADSKD